jgi:hypothetical protein
VEAAWPRNPSRKDTPMSANRKAAKPASVENPKTKTSKAKATSPATGTQAKPVAETEGREIVIEFVEHSSAAKSLQYLEISRHDRAILMGGKYLTLTKADAEKLEFVGASFAYLVYYEASERIMTVPVDGREP